MSGFGLGLSVSLGLTSSDDAVVVGGSGVVGGSVVKSDPATETEGATSLTLNGELISTGVDATAAVTLYWGTIDRGEIQFGWNGGNAPQGDLGAGAIISQQVSGLSLGTTYYYRLKANNSIGDTYSGPSAFTTPAVDRWVLVDEQNLDFLKTELNELIELED